MVWLGRGLITFGCILLAVLEVDHGGPGPLLLGLAGILLLTWIGASWVTERWARAAGRPPRLGSVLGRTSRASASQLSWLLNALLVGLWPWFWLPLAVVAQTAGGLAGSSQAFPRSRPLAPQEMPPEAQDLVRREAPDVVLLALTDRSTPNLGMAKGRGRAKSIYLRESLLGPDDADFLLPVLAHELAHHRRGDPRSAALLSIVRSTITSLGGLAMLLVLGKASDSGIAPAVTALLGFAFVGALINPVWLFFSRRREWATEVMAVGMLGDGEPLAHQLETLVGRNLGELDPPLFFYVLGATHPSPGQLIRMARSFQPLPD